MLCDSFDDDGDENWQTQEPSVSEFDEAVSSLDELEKKYEELESTISFLIKNKYPISSILTETHSDLYEKICHQEEIVEELASDDTPE